MIYPAPRPQGSDLSDHLTIWRLIVMDAEASALASPSEAWDDFPRTQFRETVNQ